MTTLAVWMTVTAYCCVGVGGSYCGATASGQQVRPGAIAAAPTVPFGTQYFIPGYGIGTVLDRGGDIGPGRLDVFFHDCRDAWAWGRRSVQVSPVSAVSVDPPWQELVEEVTYLDVDAYVTRRTYDTNRGRIDTYEVHG